MGLRLFGLLTLVTICWAAPPAIAGGCPLAADVVRGTPQIGGAGLSADFRRWLHANGYGPWAFARDDLEGGSFGGRSSPDEALRNQPVVFVHGNSDRAAGRGSDGPVGWTAVIRQFLARGYTQAELYATTWGPADPALAAEQTHSPGTVRRIRAFMEAVLGYTGTGRMDVIAHSMGVTLARRAILGGEMDGYELGAPLTDRVDAFVGIAGANLGLTACFLAEPEPTCSDEDGLFPGYPSWFGVIGESDLLDELNAASGYEGQRVYSIWSRADQLIGFGGLVYGGFTSRIPGQDGEEVYAAHPYGHFCVRDLTADTQLRMIRGEAPIPRAH
jgi:hypothetical protein